MSKAKTTARKPAARRAAGRTKSEQEAAVIARELRAAKRTRQLTKALSREVHRATIARNNLAVTLAHDADATVVPNVEYQNLRASHDRLFEENAAYSRDLTILRLELSERGDRIESLESEVAALREQAPLASTR